MTLSSVSSVFVSRFSGWWRLWLTSGLLFWWLFFHGFVEFHQTNVVLWPNIDWVRIPVRPPPAWEKGNIQFLFDSAGGTDLLLRLGCRALHGEESSDPLGFETYSLQSWHLRHFGRETTSVRSILWEKNIALTRLWFKSDWNARVTSPVLYSVSDLFPQKTSNLADVMYVMSLKDWSASDRRGSFVARPVALVEETFVRDVTLKQ